MLKRGGWVGTIPEMVKKGGGGCNKRGFGFFGVEKRKSGACLIRKTIVRRIVIFAETMGIFL